MTERALPTSHGSRNRLFIAAVIVAGTIVALIVWAVARETTVEKQIKLELAELRAAGEPIDAQDLARMFPDPPPEEDAALLFAKAFDIATNNRVSGLVPIVTTDAVPRTQKVDDVTLGRLAAFCATTAEITNTLPRTVPASARFPMRWDQGMTNRGFIDFVRVRLLTQLIATHVVEAMEAGDAERTAQMIEHGFHFTGTVNYDGFLVWHMIRHACDGLMCNVTERALNRTQFTDAQLRRMSDALRDEGTNDLRNCFRSEHGFAIWAFQAAQAGMPSEQLFGWPSRPKPWWEHMWEKVHPGQRYYSDADFLTYLRAIPQRLEFVSAPPLQAMAHAEKRTQEYNASVSTKVAEGAFPSAMKKAMANHAEAQARVVLLRTSLAIERYRLAHDGQLPDSISALVPQYLAEVPRDPFDNRPLRLKKLPPGYSVYTVAADGVDDGGLEKNLAPGTNYDLTITIER